MKAELGEGGGGNSEVLPGRGWETLAERSSNERHLGILVAGLVVAGGGMRERASAHAYLLQLPGAEGKETQPAASSEGVSLLSGALGRNQVPASVRARTCTETLIHPEATYYRED